MLLALATLAIQYLGLSADNGLTAKSYMGKHESVRCKRIYSQILEMERTGRKIALQDVNLCSNESDLLECPTIEDQSKSFLGLTLEYTFGFS